ncbi:sodium/potassium/calcium exchanger 3-like [Anastrepha ludens]|uniref:sodium/potassium/calcium exchanger 3-like n=1 Tax=Anastrepha ludens TaxID=28586 RepID=UPI0023B1DF47|nr:sodium/potassium/calcium exchanger 3-like [Anastrepha ludens]
MGENLLGKSESRAFVKSVFATSKRKQWKLWQKLRYCIFVGVILLFYINTLLFDGVWRGRAQKVSPKLRVQQSTTSRQLLSLASISAIDLENAAENVSEAVQTVGSLQSNCTAPAILEFPTDGLTRTQRQHGWIALHILLAFYCFWLLAIICDDYFLPAIELICQALHMQADVVGATFMAIATSSPELFMNCIGTFVTKGDIGIGAIVGSSVFNLLAVPACCGLCVAQYVRLDWWPVSRDCVIYCLAVVALIGTLWDGKVMWYESMLLFVAYFFYMAVMCCNDKLAHSARRLISSYRRKLHLVRPYRQVNELTPLMGQGQRNGPTIANHKFVSANSINSLVRFNVSNSSTRLYSSLEDVESCRTTSTQNDNCNLTVANSNDCTDFAAISWQRKDASWLHFLLRWPITFFLFITVPDSRKHPRAKYLTLLASILWIALVSYVVAYAITVIGDTLDIPDSVMGLTILSAGLSVPEAVSSIIVTQQGYAVMGISNAIGSNTFDILLCLSLPWFIKAYFLSNHLDEKWVAPNSGGLTYSMIFLLGSVICLFFTLLLNSFKLGRKVGWICAILYLCFIVCAVLIELNVFFPVNLPVCVH